MRGETARRRGTRLSRPLFQCFHGDLHRLLAGHRCHLPRRHDLLLLQLRQPLECGLLRCFAGLLHLHVVDALLVLESDPVGLGAVRHFAGDLRPDSDHVRMGLDPVSKDEMVRIPSDAIHHMG